MGGIGLPRRNAEVFPRIAGTGVAGQEAANLILRNEAKSTPGLPVAIAARKLAMTIPEIREILSTIRAVCVVSPLDIENHELGLELAERYGFSIYDGLIVAAAVRVPDVPFSTRKICSRGK